MQFSQLATVKHRLEVGVPLPFNVRDADQTLMLARGQVVGSFEQMEALFKRGALVDVAELHALRPDVLQAAPEALPKLWEQCMARVGQTLQNSSQTGFAAALDEVSAPVLQLIERDADLAVFQVLRHEGLKDVEYGMTHSVHTAISSFLVAQRLGWDAASVQKAFKVALTMNLGMLELQGVLATQNTPLTAAQRQVIHEHPQLGVEMLERTGIKDADWLQAVAQHHETTDGNGYPAGLREVCDLAALVRRADIYTAKLSPRVGRDAMAADQAGRTMFMQDPGHPMSAALAKEFGVYPPGCFVKLMSGETAVVMKRGLNVTSPWVAALTSAHGVPLTEPVPRNTSRREYAIAAVVHQTSVRARISAEKLMQVSFA
jgi:HD-GYP domain-containing protein (c-di-GMP phosphodiesterase class II)